ARPRISTPRSVVACPVSSRCCGGGGCWSRPDRLGASGYVLVHDHVALRIGLDDPPPQGSADGVRVAQRLVAVKLDMDVDEDAAAGGTGLQVVETVHPWPGPRDLGDALDDRRIGA